VSVLDVVHVDLAYGVDAIEELGLAGQSPLESGETVERRTLEVVATTAVGTTGAATAVGSLAMVGFSPRSEAATALAARIMSSCHDGHSSH